MIIGFSSVTGKTFRDEVKVARLPALVEVEL
jgi:hypothetical protein